MDQKNFIVAIVLSVLIIVGWQYAFPPAKPPINNTARSSRRPIRPVARRHRKRPASRLRRACPEQPARRVPRGRS